MYSDVLTDMCTCICLVFVTNLTEMIIRYFLQNGYTPIHLASSDGHIQVVEKLISSGADVNVINKVSI